MKFFSKICYDFIFSVIGCTSLTVPDSPRCLILTMYNLDTQLQTTVV